MARHEFGIMQNAPEPRKRYDEYEPQKYNCISVDDDYIEDIVTNFNHIDFYWHSLDMPAKGIAYTGITLVPPISLQAFIAVIKDIAELNTSCFQQKKLCRHISLTTFQSICLLHFRLLWMAVAISIFSI